MTSADLTTVMPRYQAILAQRDRELMQLRELRCVVLDFLNRRASFAELRQAVNQSEVGQQ